MSCLRQSSALQRAGVSERSFTSHPGVSYQVGSLKTSEGNVFKIRNNYINCEKLRVFVICMI